MKWRNSKERELIAHGGCREQTLPTKHNPNPDLSDPVSPASSHNSKQIESDQSSSNTNSHSSSQHQIPPLTSKPPSLPYLGLPQSSLIHPSHHPSLAAAALPWDKRFSSISSDFATAFKRGNAGQSLSSPSDIAVSIDPTMRGLGCESIDGDDDNDIDEDIEVEDVGESDDEDKDEVEEHKRENTYESALKNRHDDGIEKHSDDDIQVT
jgi:hypothetical protein